jgi:uncharacterized membrane protein
MKALARLPAVVGITAMQSINVAILNRWFLSVFFGTAVASAFLVVVSLLRWQRQAPPICSPEECSTWSARCW